MHVSEVEEGEHVTGLASQVVVLDGHLHIKTNIGHKEAFKISSFFLRILFYYQVYLPRS